MTGVHMRLLTRLTGCVVLTLLALCGCSATRPWSFVEPTDQRVDVHPLAEAPDEREPSLYWDAVNQSSFYLIENSLDLPRQYRKLVDWPRESFACDVFGNVPNSSWFTNRHGVQRMTIGDIRKGPNTIDGPDTTRPWTITRAKTQGVTPGFFAKDANGETFIIKFDPAGYPELATGAELVCTKFFHACGYNVPENYLSVLDPATIQIRDDLEYADNKGHHQPFTREVLNEMLNKVARRPDGKVRVVASRFLPGQPLGPFSYKGTRHDDANDLIPHQHRRDLRGLKVMAELVNHFDTKDHNSLDILANDGNGPYVRHYLIDFGSTLGSDADEPKPVDKGYAYSIDLEQAFVSLVTLGLRKWSWEGASAEGMPPAVGYFESERFTPPGWKPLHANPAFDNMSDNDAYWGARIVASFTEDDLRACIDAAEYSDPAAADYLLNTLMERRRKIVDYYYSKVDPLDHFAIHHDESGLTISFVDRWMTDGVGSADEVLHRVRFGHMMSGWGSYRKLDGDNTVTVDPQTIKRMEYASRASADRHERVFHLQIQSRRNGHWGHWVRAYFYYTGDPVDTRLVGVEWDE